MLTKFTTELSAENTAAINKVLTDRTAWSEKNVRAIETWLMEYFEQIEPPVTDLPQSTIAIETTTNGSSAIFIPIVALFMGIFLQIVNIMN